MRGLAVTALIVLAAVAAPSGALAATTCFGQPATIVGRGTITGTPWDDVIVGSRLDDQIDGMGGNDLIRGRSGNDSIESGTALVQSGAIVWFGGGDGNDNVQGPGWATEIHLFGGKGDDFIADNPGYLAASVEIDGGEGDDLIASQGPGDADAKTSVISGGRGNDRIFYRVDSYSPVPATLDLTIEGGDGDDDVEADVSENYSPSLDASILILGGDGNDLLQGTALGAVGAATTTIANVVRGGVGDHELFAGSGAGVTNRIDGGPHVGGDICHRGAGSSDRFRQCEQIV